MVRLLCVLPVLLSGATLASAAQEPAAPAAESAAAQIETGGDGLGDASSGLSDRGPVPVPEPSEKAMRYYRGGNRLWLLNVAWGLAVPALFLLTGFSARMRDWARRVGRRWFFTVAVYLVLWGVLNFLIDLPLAYYQGFVRQHAYELSTQSFGKWMGDAVKGLAVGLVAAVLFAWIPFLLIAKSPRRWWLYTGLAVVPFLVFAILVSPIWVAPLFNDFGPMQDEALERDVLALAERAGIEDGRVFEVDKSVDTKAVNAYVTGILGTERIVLWDTIIEKLERDELLFVMGHEMGHYVLGHVLKTIALLSLMILAALYLIHRTAGALIARYGRRFGFGELSDVASLPLLLLMLNLFFLALAPLALGYSRHQEREADRFGLELVRDNRAAATAFVKLQQENLGNPRPGWLYVLWRASHPTLGDRIDFCNEYRPWETGEPLRYGHLFREGE